MTDTDLINVNPYEVMFIIHRDRDRAEFELIKDSIRQMGIRQPIKAQSILDWPVEKRRRPDGGVYKWRALYGEGRCTAAIELYEKTNDENFLRVPAQIEAKATSADIAGA